MRLCAGEGPARSDNIPSLEERVRGRGPFSLDIVTSRAGVIPLLDPPCPQCHTAWRGWGVELGEWQVRRMPWDPPVFLEQLSVVLGPVPLAHPSRSSPGLDLVLCNTHPPLGLGELQCPAAPSSSCSFPLPPSICHL